MFLISLISYMNSESVFVLSFSLILMLWFWCAGEWNRLHQVRRGMCIHMYQDHWTNTDWLMMIIYFTYAQCFIKNTRGLKLFTCKWLPTNQEPRALIFLCHGYGMECMQHQHEQLRSTHIMIFYGYFYVFIKISKLLPTTRED